MTRFTRRLLHALSKRKLLLTPGMLPRPRSIALLGTLVVVLYCINEFSKPLIKRKNAHPVNTYGEEGHQHLPHALIIGTKKAGTRAMLSYLKRHPDISMAQSEVHFFNKWRNYRQGIEWYRGLMPYSRPGQITIEKTPNYFHTPGVPERIHSMNSSVKLVLCVRDPIKRALSEYLEQCHSYPIIKSFFAFEDIVQSRNFFHKIIEHSNYVTILDEWLKFFPLEQILIIDGDILGANPIKELHNTESFLGLRRYFNDNMFVYNEDKTFVCFQEHPQNRKRCLGTTKGRIHPEIDEKVRKQLVEYYHPHNKRLFELIGRRFNWTDS